MAILKIKDENGKFIDIPAIQGGPGPQGPIGPQGPEGPQGPAGEGGVSLEEVKAITGELDNLSTEDKSNLVNAINEVLVSGGETDNNVFPIYSLYVGYTTSTSSQYEYLNSSLPNASAEVKRIIENTIGKGLPKAVFFTICATNVGVTPRRFDLYILTNYSGGTSKYEFYSYSDAYIITIRGKWSDEANHKGEFTPTSALLTPQTKKYYTYASQEYVDNAIAALRAELTGGQ